MTRQEKLELAIEAAKAFMGMEHPTKRWWIVGGALRDTDMDRDFNDIDIFINGDPEDALPNEDTDDGDRNAYLRRASRHDIVYHGIEFELNLIHMRGVDWSLQRVTDRCDFGICMIGYDPETGYTYRSHRYVYDLKFKYLRVCRETTTERKERMEKKFPDFRYRNPHNLKFDGARVWAYNKETGKIIEGVHKLKQDGMFT